PGRTPSWTAPFGAVQTNACEPSSPTTIVPRLFTPRAVPESIGTIPVATDQRKAWLGPPAVPTITDPSELLAEALLNVRPGRNPRPTIPALGDHRNAWSWPPLSVWKPTTTEPSALTPHAYP